MSVILNIDTATEKAHVSFARDGKLLHAIWSESQKDHASFLQSAVSELTKITGIKLQELDAIAVTAGPGSYTGLRVGLSSAKGLCYALKKPLIAMSTLEVMTTSVILAFPELDNDILYCPMIDARRMEVFTAVYKKDLSQWLAPCPMILDEFSFSKELASHRIIFFGPGSAKWEPICRHTNALFEKKYFLSEAMAHYSHILHFQGLFSDLAYSEPFYLKEFQTVSK